MEELLEILKSYKTQCIYSPLRYLEQYDLLHEKDPQVLKEHLEPFLSRLARCNATEKSDIRQYLLGHCKPTDSNYRLFKLIYGYYFNQEAISHTLIAALADLGLTQSDALQSAFYEQNQEPGLALEYQRVALERHSLEAIEKALLTLSPQSPAYLPQIKMGARLGSPKALYLLAIHWAGSPDEPADPQGLGDPSDTPKSNTSLNELLYIRLLKLSAAQGYTPALETLTQFFSEHPQYCITHAESSYYATTAYYLDRTNAILREKALNEIETLLAINPFLGSHYAGTLAHIDGNYTKAYDYLKQAVDACIPESLFSFAMFHHACLQQAKKCKESNQGLEECVEQFSISDPELFLTKIQHAILDSEKLSHMLSAFRQHDLMHIASANADELHDIIELHEKTTGKKLETQKTALRKIKDNIKVISDNFTKTAEKSSFSTIKKSAIEYFQEASQLGITDAEFYLETLLADKEDPVEESETTTPSQKLYNPFNIFRSRKQVSTQLGADKSSRSPEQEALHHVLYRNITHEIPADPHLLQDALFSLSNLVKNTEKKSSLYILGLSFNDVASIEKLIQKYPDYFSKLFNQNDIDKLLLEPEIAIALDVYLKRYFEKNPTDKKPGLQNDIACILSYFYLSIGSIEKAKALSRLIPTSGFVNKNLHDLKSKTDEMISLIDFYKKNPEKIKNPLQLRNILIILKKQGNHNAVKKIMESIQNLYHENKENIYYQYHYAVIFKDANLIKILFLKNPERILELFFKYDLRNTASTSFFSEIIGFEFDKKDCTDILHDCVRIISAFLNIQKNLPKLSVADCQDIIDKKYFSKYITLLKSQIAARSIHESLVFLQPQKIGSEGLSGSTSAPPLPYINELIDTKDEKQKLPPIPIPHITLAALRRKIAGPPTPEPISTLSTDPQNPPHHAGEETPLIGTLPTDKPPLQAEIQDKQKQRQDINSPERAQIIFALHEIQTYLKTQLENHQFFYMYRLGYQKRLIMERLSRALIHALHNPEAHPDLQAHTLKILYFMIQKLDQSQSNIFTGRFAVALKHIKKKLANTTGFRFHEIRIDADQHLLFGRVFSILKQYYYLAIDYALFFYRKASELFKKKNKHQQVIDIEVETHKAIQQTVFHNTGRYQLALLFDSEDHLHLLLKNPQEIIQYYKEYDQNPETRDQIQALVKKIHLQSEGLHNASVLTAEREPIPDRRVTIQNPSSKPPSEPTSDQIARQRIEKSYHLLIQYEKQLACDQQWFLKKRLGYQKYRVSQGLQKIMMDADNQTEPPWITLATISKKVSQIKALRKELYSARFKTVLAQISTLSAPYATAEISQHYDSKINLLKPM